MILSWITNMALGAISAAGFGMLFNFGWRDLGWCAAAGALALAVRTMGLDAGLSLEAASFAAAVSLGCCVRLLRSTLGPARNALAVAGCIPMIPGSFAAKAIMGMFVLSSAGDSAMATTSTTVEYLLRMAFTLGAIGTGLSITIQLLDNKDF